MIRFTKRLLYRALGPERYLRTVSAVFLRMYRARLLVRSFPEHYFIEKLVEPGDYVIDIGANLGYYTVPLSRLVGPEGRVWAVEPVPLFASILKRNLRMGNPANTTVVEAALGCEARESVEMSVPTSGGVLRHGLAHIGPEAGARSFFVPMRTPEQLFAGLSRLDYLKCDVEGYEVEVLLPFRSIFARCKPAVQVEISSAENRQTLFRFFSELGYDVFILRNGRLAGLSNVTDRVQGDYYFIPGSSSESRPENVKID